jgi:hypothetical protein
MEVVSLVVDPIKLHLAENHLSNACVTTQPSKRPKLVSAAERFSLTKRSVERHRCKTKIMSSLTRDDHALRYGHRRVVRSSLWLGQAFKLWKLRLLHWCDIAVVYRQPYIMQPYVHSH